MGIGMIMMNNPLCPICHRISYGLLPVGVPIVCPNLDKTGNTITKGRKKLFGFVQLNEVERRNGRGPYETKTVQYFSLLAHPTGLGMPARTGDLYVPPAPNAGLPPFPWESNWEWKLMVLAHNYHHTKSDRKRRWALLRKRRRLYWLKG